MYDDHDHNNNVMCKVLKGKKKFIVEIVDSDFFRSWWMSSLLFIKRIKTCEHIKPRQDRDFYLHECSTMMMSTTWMVIYLHHQSCMISRLQLIHIGVKTINIIYQKEKNNNK